MKIFTHIFKIHAFLIFFSSPGGAMAPFGPNVGTPMQRGGTQIFCPDQDLPNDLTDNLFQQILKI